VLGNEKVKASYPSSLKNVTYITITTTKVPPPPPPTNNSNRYLEEKKNAERLI
jgi:hypothetical protein